MTTNETDKWANLREDMRDGLVYRGLLRNHGDDDDDINPDRNSDNNHYHKNSDKEGEGEEDSRWPHQSRYIVLVLDDNNNSGNAVSTDRTQTPPVLPAHIANKLSDTVDPASWQRVWHLGDVENIYDVGFWTALADVWSGWDCRIGGWRAE